MKRGEAIWYQGRILDKDERKAGIETDNLRNIYVHTLFLNVGFEIKQPESKVEFFFVNYIQK